MRPMTIRPVRCQAFSKALFNVLLMVCVKALYFCRLSLAVLLLWGLGAQIMPAVADEPELYHYDNGNNLLHNQTDYGSERHFYATTPDNVASQVSTKRSYRKPPPATKVVFIDTGTMASARRATNTNADEAIDETSKANDANDANENVALDADDGAIIDELPTYDGADDIWSEVDEIDGGSHADADGLDGLDSYDDSAAIDEGVLDVVDMVDNDAKQHTQVSLNAISPTTLKTFVEVIDLVRRDYVEPVSDEVLFNDAMSGMLTKLDSHAEFLDADAYENLRAFTQGDVGSVGLQAVYQPSLGYWVVTDVAVKSSAAKEGIQAGNYLHQIGMVKLTEDKTANDIEQMLTGIAGSQVEVVVSKAGRRKRTLVLQRNQTREQALQIRLQNGLAIVKLPVFQNNSHTKILEGIAKLDAPITGILLDLRDNPGGVLEAAVDIAGLFMADKDVVQVHNRHGIERTLHTGTQATLSALPVLILQNRYSASAAEVLASSLQAQGQAVIVGETSYGKGSVQSVIPINDEQAIKLTVAHYLTADGQQIDDVGVTPDIALHGNEGLWEQQAITLLLGQNRPAGIKFVQRDATASADAPSTDEQN